MRDGRKRQKGILHVVRLCGTLWDDRRAHVYRAGFIRADARARTTGLVLSTPISRRSIAACPLDVRTCTALLAERARSNKEADSSQIQANSIQIQVSPQPPLSRSSPSGRPPSAANDDHEPDAPRIETYHVLHASRPACFLHSRCCCCLTSSLHRHHPSDQPIFFSHLHFLVVFAGRSRRPAGSHVERSQPIHPPARSHNRHWGAAAHLLAALLAVLGLLPHRCVVAAAYLRRRNTQSTRHALYSSSQKHSSPLFAHIHAFR